MKIQKFALALCCIVTMFVAGCGSSSKSGTTTTTTSNINGVFADAPVVGLSYSCESTTGVTGTGGAFTCPKSSTVTFTIGGTTICSAPAQAFMTPVTCAQANGDPTANASTPSVVATAQWVISVGTPAGTTPGTLTTLTITSAEIQAAATVTLNFSSDTIQSDMLTALAKVNPQQSLISQTAATLELAGTINTNAAGTYSGTYSGGDTGTWTVTVDNFGNVSGSYTSNSGSGGTGTISGNFDSGTTYSGSAGENGAWTGNLNTSQPPTTGTGPYLFSGTWTNTKNDATGTFTN